MVFRFWWIEYISYQVLNRENIYLITLLLTTTTDEGACHFTWKAIRKLDCKLRFDAHNFGETSTMLIVRTLSPTSSGRTQVCSLIPSFTDILPPSQAWITGCARVTNPSDSYECIVYDIGQLFVIRLQGQNRREDIYAILISISQGWYYSPTLSPTFRFFTELPILVMIPTPMCYNISWLYGYPLCIVQVENTYHCISPRLSYLHDRGQQDSWRCPNHCFAYECRCGTIWIWTYETIDTIRDVVSTLVLVCILYCNDRRHTHITHNSELYSPTVRDIQLNLSSSKSWKSNVF